MNIKNTVGIIAHVDAGKTTLCEAILYKAKVIRTQGSVEKGNTCFDFNYSERKHKITVYSKEASFDWNHATIYLIDTPGHNDFYNETLRVLPVLDTLVFVISATEFNKPQNLKLFRNVENIGIPLIFFISKTDMIREDRSLILKELRSSFSEKFLLKNDTNWEQEQAALVNEEFLESFINGDDIKTESIIPYVKSGSVIPLIFGSGITGEGVDTLLDLLAYLGKDYEKLSYSPDISQQSAIVYKIDSDNKRQRQTHIKVLSGCYSVKSVINEGQTTEKIQEIRYITGQKCKPVSSVSAGDICVLMGLNNSKPGDLLGKEISSPSPQGLLCYSVIPQNIIDTAAYYQALKKMQDEEPSYAFVFPEANSRLPVQVHLNGELQEQIFLDQLLLDYHIPAKLSSLVPEYKETIDNIVFGNGHFEPLRHYAEVRFKISPLPTGSGLIFDSICSDEILDKHWQTLILSQIAQKSLYGVLAGYPITDMRISLCGGKAHLKHTEGGDFLEAAVRALRQGLMKANTVLLEPFVDFILRCDTASLGKCLQELDSVGCVAESQTSDADGSVYVSGKGPLCEISSIKRKYSICGHGRFQIDFSNPRDLPCHNTVEVLKDNNYSPENDIILPCDSIFCTQGAGHTVKWDAVDDLMHSDPYRDIKTLNQVSNRGYKLSEKEFSAILERSFINSNKLQYLFPKREAEAKEKSYTDFNLKSRIYLIDGNNLLHELIKSSNYYFDSIELLKEALLNDLYNWTEYSGNRVQIVFDGYSSAITNCQNNKMLHISYSNGESADVILEREAEAKGPSYSIIMVTADNLMQTSAIKSGILRMSAREFLIDMSETIVRMREIINSQQKDLKIPLYNLMKIEQVP